MAAKKLSSRYSTLIVKPFHSFVTGYQMIKDLTISIKNFQLAATEAINDHGTRLEPSSGAGAPSTTPDNIGLHYIDTSASKVYYSIGTSSSADWKILN